MNFEPVTDQLYILRGLVNVYLMETDDGLALIDTGFRSSGDKILAALAALGRRPDEIRHIVITHAHPDHMGSAAQLKRATGAQVYAHAIDAPIIETGTGFRRGKPAPGWRNFLLVHLLLRRTLKKPFEPTHVDHLIEDGIPLPFAPDLVPIHTPGHAAGQVSLLWRRDGNLLFTADACINIRGLDVAAAHEDIAETLRSLRKLCTFDFDKAVFGHGPPILARADEAFRRKWAA